MPGIEDQDVVIGLGANLGSRQASFRAALDLLEAGAQCEVRALSHLFDSQALAGHQPRYLNAAFRGSSALGLPALLKHVKDVERMLGRVPAERWGPRCLDLDILWSSRPFEGVGLTVPHTELRARWFAMQPMLEVAPELARDYGDDLLAAGGERPPLAQLERVPNCAITNRADGFAVRASQGDRADLFASAATAACLRAWAVAAGPGLEVRSLQLECRPAEEWLSLCQGVYGLAQRGFLTRQVMLVDLEAGAMRARAVGRPGRAGRWRFEGIWERPAAVGLEVVQKAR